MCGARGRALTLAQAARLLADNGGAAWLAAQPPSATRVFSSLTSLASWAASRDAAQARPAGCGPATSLTGVDAGQGGACRAGRAGGSRGVAHVARSVAQPAPEAAEAGGEARAGCERAAQGAPAARAQPPQAPGADAHGRGGGGGQSAALAAAMRAAGLLSIPAALQRHSAEALVGTLGSALRRDAWQGPHGCLAAAGGGAAGVAGPGGARPQPIAVEAADAWQPEAALVPLSAPSRKKKKRRKRAGAPDAAAAPAARDTAGGAPQPPVTKQAVAGAPAARDPAGGALQPHATEQAAAAPAEAAATLSGDLGAVAAGAPPERASGALAARSEEAAAADMPASPPAGAPAGKKRRRRRKVGAHVEGAPAALAGLAQPAALEAGACSREPEAAGLEASCAAAGEAAESSRAAAGGAAEASCAAAGEATAAHAKPAPASPAPRSAAAPPQKPAGRGRRSPAMGTPEGADRVAAAAAALAAGLPAVLQDTGARQRWLRAQGDVLARLLQGRDTGSLLERLSAAAGALPELQARPAPRPPLPAYVRAPAALRDGLEGASGARGVCIRQLKPCVSPRPCAALLCAPRPCAALLCDPRPCAALLCDPRPCAALLCDPRPCAALLCAPPLPRRVRWAVGAGHTRPTEACAPACC